MDPFDMELCETQEESSPQLPFARSYQLEALEKAIKQNTIVFLETGSGKTLIAIMLLRYYAHFLRRPAQPYIAVFLVPKVVLVTQQAEAIEKHTDLKVGKYWGDMGVDFWDAATWKEEQEKYEVLVMTPKILLDALSHTYIKLDMIKVLIFDECHNARGKHPYACIMKDFYHRQLDMQDVPRIFGMTASPVKGKAKGSGSDAYWKDIRALESLMHSKVYTCANEAVLAEYIPFPNAKVQFYNEQIPNSLQKHLIDSVSMLMKKQVSDLGGMDVERSTQQSLCSKVRKLSSTFQFCLGELGVWPAIKAAEILSLEETDIFSWGPLDLHGQATIRAFNSNVLKELSAYMRSGFNGTISDMKASTNDRLLSSKVLCLVDSILGYRNLKDLRCIIFVERVITAMVLEVILGKLLSESIGWRARYIAGNQSALRPQSRKEQNKIVEEFRGGTMCLLVHLQVHILVATSILEEGLDVQSCNLVVRFDPSANVCSFIQSRGRARMQDSDFLLMVKRGDASEISRVQKYLSSGDVMRKQSIKHASLPCQPIMYDELDMIFYRVESTGAIVTLSYSVSLIYFYCSRLPSDRYYKPSPRFSYDVASETCTIYFPNSCRIQPITVQGNTKILKQLACLEACKKLHEIGALTDNLVPDIVIEEGILQELGNEIYDEDQACYVPPELASHGPRRSSDVYHIYFIELKQKFCGDVPVHDIILVVKTEIDMDIGGMQFDLEVEWGNISVQLKYSGKISLTNEQVLLCKQFQVAVLRVLRDHDLSSLVEAVEKLYKAEQNGSMHLPQYDYLLLPCDEVQSSPVIDWKSIRSVSFLCNEFQGSPISYNVHQSLSHDEVYTKNGYVHVSVLENCLVYTPHNGSIYCASGFLDGMNGNSLLRLNDGEVITYKSYYKKRHGIELCFEEQGLIRARKLYKLHNYLQRCRQRKEKEGSNAFVELPPELCVVIMSPISGATLYSFSFVPSIMHRVESLILSINLRRNVMDHCKQNVIIPATKVLEALTTKHCQEQFHLESLETVGDSFLKYAVSQQLFKTYQNNHEGLLSIKKEKIVSNDALCRLGCERKIPGFIRNKVFDPKRWIIPGDLLGNCVLEEEFLSTKRKIYSNGIQKLKSKRVADVVEALIGAFLISGGEATALSFMNWLGIEVELSCVKYQREFSVHPSRHVNIRHLESLLNYSFEDPSLLVEALTHGSYMLPEIPVCYQRLEFLGDAVLDHLITVHFYYKHPGLSPELLTDLRSASVNNDCYARTATRAGLHKHILHASYELHKQITIAVASFKELPLESTFGWESTIKFPDVLADVIESLAGAIFVDSGYNKEVVFRSILPLLEPLVTPETVKINPVRELHEICQKHHYKKRMVKALENGVFCRTMEVEANGQLFSHTCTSCDVDTAMKIASKAILKSMKETIPDL